MKKILAWLTRIDRNEHLIKILLAWRLWLVGALVGALLAAGVYAVAPPPYRAQATVLVDHNVEEAWQYFPDRQLFLFLRRESNRLQALAWADDTLQAVVDQVGATSVNQLRDEVLMLSHPQDGAWHFLAQHEEAERAEQLAAAWAMAFTHGVEAGRQVAPELEAARAELGQIVSENPQVDEAQIAGLLEQIVELGKVTYGISPYLEVAPMQLSQLPVTRTVPQSTYLMLGALAGVLAALLLALFFAPLEDGDA